MPPELIPPDVSVLMAVYNAEVYVESAVRSVLNQTYRNFELVILNDGSADGSLAILESLALEDTRIRLSSQTNKGLVRTANAMIALAKGRYLSLMDHDDEMLPACLAEEVAHLELHPECVAVGVLSCYIDGSGKVTRQRTNFAGLLAGYSRRIPSLTAFPPRTPFIGNPASMVRSDAMRQVGGYREAFAYANDIDLWFRLAENGEVHRLNKMLLRYRRHGTNATFRHRGAIVMYDVVSHLSAWARHYRLNDEGLIDNFRGPDNFLSTVEAYKRLIGVRYPTETFIYYRALGSRLPEIAGASSRVEMQQLAFAHIKGALNQPGKLQLLRRALAQAFSRRKG